MGWRKLVFYPEPVGAQLWSRNGERSFIEMETY